ncbi:ATP synthase F0 subunit B [bacterium]|nr:ATP synthase F0 subunit B [bacterium]
MTSEQLLILSTVINFSVVVLILYKAGRTPAIEFFQGRSKEISTFVNEARSVSAQARQEKEKWAAKLSGAPEEMRKAHLDTEASLKRYSEGTLARANGEAKRISEDSKVVIQAESQRAKRRLRQQIARESISQARAYLDNHVESADNHKLLTDYLERVSHGHAG